MSEEQQGEETLESKAEQIEETPSDSVEAVQEAEASATEIDDASQAPEEGDAADAEEADEEPVAAAVSEPAPKKRGKIIGIVVAIIVVLCLIGVGGTAVGIIPVPGAAVKYGAFDYIFEDEITNYIATYKKQMGYENATDEEWASFLAAYNLTPERLRQSTANELLTERAVEARAKELGVSVSDEEVDEVVAAFKDAYAFNDDEIFESTLAEYGQTLEGFRSVQRMALLKERLLYADCKIDEPTTDEVRSTIQNFVAYHATYDECDQFDEDGSNKASLFYDTFVVKHSYCFGIQFAGDEASLSDYEKCELIKDEFVESGTDVETFLALMSLYCDVDELKENDGAMGWDADTTEYSSAFATALAKTDVGEVSDSFNDDGMECFVWVDQGFTMPYDPEEVTTMDLSAMPSSLYQYFRDVTLYNNREDISDQYFRGLVSNLNATLYVMPDNVPYNVDMSAYTEE